jgi:hypothetical protein
MWLGTDELHVMMLNAPSTGGLSNSTTETCKPTNMGRYQSAMFLIGLGTNGVTTSNFWLMEASTATAAGQATGKYNYRTSSTATAYATANALSTRAAGVSTALTLASTAETFYVIEVKSDDLTEGYPFVYPSVSSAAATRNATVFAIMKPRYAQSTMLVPNS